MTGWRLGYAAGPAAVLQQMAKLQQYTFICRPRPAATRGTSGAGYRHGPGRLGIPQKRRSGIRSPLAGI